MAVDARTAVDGSDLHHNRTAIPRRLGAQPVRGPAPALRPCSVEPLFGSGHFVHEHEAVAKGAVDSSPLERGAIV